MNEPTKADYERWLTNHRADLDRLREVVHMCGVLADAWAAKGNEETWFSVPADELRYLLRRAES